MGIINKRNEPGQVVYAFLNLCMYQVAISFIDD